jgi:hypothetical protein
MIVSSLLFVNENDRIGRADKSGHEHIASRVYHSECCCYRLSIFGTHLANGEWCFNRSLRLRNERVDNVLRFLAFRDRGLRVRAMHRIPLVAIGMSATTSAPGAAADQVFDHE